MFLSCRAAAHGRPMGLGDRVVKCHPMVPKCIVFGFKVIHIFKIYRQVNDRDSFNNIIEKRSPGKTTQKMSSRRPLCQ